MKINAAGVRRDVIVIGASAGGFEAIRGVVSLFPKDMPAIVGVVLHRAPFFKSEFDQIMQRWSPMSVVEPTGPTPLDRGTIYLAPPDRHMRFMGSSLFLDRGPKEHFTRPAVDALFMSAAEAFGPRVVGVVLSGNGSDGLLGCLAIKAAGGLVLVQNPAEAECTSMPVAALRQDHVDAHLDVKEMADVLGRLALGATVELPNDHGK